MALLPISPEEQKVFARFMEVYAGFLEHADYEVGRLVNHLKSTGQLDNTAIFLILGDNGGSKEGTEYGVTNKNLRFGAEASTREDYKKFILSEYDKIGSPNVLQVANYPLGWAQASNTPFKFWKSDANAEGATHNPLIVHYPKGINAKGEIRSQFGHVTDLLPTIEDITNVAHPSEIKGIKQDPIHGKSLVYSFENPTAPEQHTQQYFTIFGNRSIYKDGWKAGAAHRPNALDLFAFKGEKNNALENNPDNDEWELYNLKEDFNERVNLAKKYPEKLKELKDLFDAEAKKYNIYPLIDIEHAAERYKIQLQK